MGEKSRPLPLEVTSRPLAACFDPSDRSHAPNGPAPATNCIGVRVRATGSLMGGGFPRIPLATRVTERLRPVSKESTTTLISIQGRGRDQQKPRGTDRDPRWSNPGQLSKRIRVVIMDCARRRALNEDMLTREAIACPTRHRVLNAPIVSWELPKGLRLGRHGGTSCAFSPSAAEPP